MISNLNPKGSVRVETFNEDGILDVYEESNMVVRQGRANLLNVLNGRTSFDTSYIITDTTLGFYPWSASAAASSTGRYPVVGLLVNGTALPFYVGVKRDYTGAAIGPDPLIYDIDGLVTRLNETFAGNGEYVYSPTGDFIAQTAGGEGRLVAQTIIKSNGAKEIKISFVNPSEGNTLRPYSTNNPPSPIPGFPAPPVFFPPLMTMDDLFGTNTVTYDSTSSTSGNPYVLSTIELGTGTEVATIDSSAFPSGTYTSGGYPVSITDVQDPNSSLVTSSQYIIVIPKEEGNGLSGSGVTYTEAALKHTNLQWFAHVNLGQVYKNDTIGLRIVWTINFLPQ
jgi:hypothetical protein